MRLWTDRRGQAIQVGAIILFGFLVLSFASYQAYLVPQQNAQVEFDHNQEVQEDLSKLRATIVEASYPQQSAVVTVDMGTGYPARLIAQNPPPTSGSLRTSEPGSMTVDGASDVCAGEDTTRSFTYEPNYNAYDGPSSVYENTVLFNSQDGGESNLTGQSLVFPQEGVVNLVALRGDVDRTTGSTVTLDVVSGESRWTEDVQDPTVTVPTTVSEDSWEEVIPSPVSDDDISVTGGNLEVELTGSYDVVCTPVGLGAPPPSGASELKPPALPSNPGGTPTFASPPSITDNSGTGPRRAEYEVQYSVDDPGSNFRFVRATFDCLDCGGSGDETTTMSQTTGTITYSESGGQSYGSEYRITIEVVDDGGDVTDTYEDTDTANGPDAT